VKSDLRDGRVSVQVDARNAEAPVLVSIRLPGNRLLTVYLTPPNAEELARDLGPVAIEARRVWRPPS